MMFRRSVPAPAAEPAPWRDHRAEPPWTIGEIAGFVGGMPG
jgi:hypothetical protein